MSTSHDELRVIALAEFARAGYAATSLQRITQLAGLSKASVLYHFAPTTHSALERMRFGIALGGAAYFMASQHQYELQAAPTIDETRVALIAIVTELLAPAPVRPITP